MWKPDTKEDPRAPRVVKTLEPEELGVSVPAIALTVYHVLGLRILRSAWVNLDRVWAAAMVGAGSATVIAAFA